MKTKPAEPAASPTQAPSPRPAGAEEIPCRSKNRPAWKYVLLAAIFLAWLSFLIYCAVV
jgi:hypothetical protein